MKNIAIASLLGATYGAAVLGPLPKDHSNWPKFTTITTLATGTAGDVTEANFKNGSNLIGPYRGWRNGYVTYPTQNVVKWATSATSVALG